MDMLLAVVWADDDVPVDLADAAGLRARIADAVEGPLAALGVEEYLLNVRDEAVSGALIDVRVTPRPVLAALRARVPAMGEDRYLAPDLEAAAALIHSAALTAGLTGHLPKVL